MSRHRMTAPALAVLLATGCNRGEAPASKPAPAKVTAAVPESALTTITLTARRRSVSGSKRRRSSAARSPGPEASGEK